MYELLTSSLRGDGANQLEKLDVDDRDLSSTTAQWAYWDFLVSLGMKRFRHRLNTTAPDFFAVSVNALFPIMKGRHRDIGPETSLL
ncbi:MAG: hypothetical protein Q9201_004966 [Fulgogasparrea decipioides]